MIREKNNSLLFSWILFSVVLFLFGTVYYQERTLFLDNAFQTFRLIQDGSIVINAYRWPAGVYRILPLIIVQLTLPLNIVLLSLSLSYVFIPVALLFYLFKKLKYIQGALVFIALSTLPVQHGFFWCNSELILALQICVVLWSCIEKNAKSTGVFLAIVLAWVHPLCVIPFIFLSVYTLLAAKCKSNHLPYLSGFCISYFVKAFWFRNWYDSIKQDELLRNFSVVDFTVLTKAWEYTNKIDVVVLICLVAACVLLMYKRLWSKLILYLLFIISGILLFTLVSGAGAPEFYSEINDYILFFIAALVLSKEIGIVNIKTYNWLVISCIVFASIRWFMVSEFYSNRIAWYEDTLSQYDRVIFYPVDMEFTPLVLPWASAYESILISSLQGHSKSIYFTNDGDKLNLVQQDSLLVTEYNSYPIQSLNKSYFRMENIQYSRAYLD